MQQDAALGTFQTSDGCAIAYNIHSAGNPNLHRMVLIHSLALDASIWDGVVARLAGRAEILRYDCRGHGRSGRPGGPFTTELFARDLAELVRFVDQFLPLSFVARRFEPAEHNMRDARAAR